VFALGTFAHSVWPAAVTDFDILVRWYLGFRMEDGCEDGCGILFGVLSVGGDVSSRRLCVLFSKTGIRKERKNDGKKMEQQLQR